MFYQFWYETSTQACYRSLKFLGFPEYRIGDDGSIWAFQSRDITNHGRVWRWCKLVPHAGSLGHQRITLTAGKTRKRFLIHHLVLLAFVGPPPRLEMQCRHFPDRNPANNRVTNLIWGTAKQNQEDRKAQGTCPMGATHPQSRLTQEVRDEIASLYVPYKTGARELAERYGVSRMLIRRILRQAGKITTKRGTVV